MWLIIEVLENFFNDPNFMYLHDMELGIHEIDIEGLLKNTEGNINLEGPCAMNTDPGQGQGSGSKTNAPTNRYGTGFTGNRYNVRSEYYYPSSTSDTGNPTSTSSTTSTGNPTGYPLNPGTGYPPGTGPGSIFDRGNRLNLINWQAPPYPNSLGYKIGKEFSICPLTNTYIITDPTNIALRGYIDPTTGNPYPIQQPYIGNLAAALEHATGNTDQKFNGATVSGATFRWNEHQYYHAYTEYNAIKSNAPSGEDVEIQNSAIRRLIMKQTRR